MTRLLMVSSQQYEKATKAQILEKVQEVVDMEVERSTLFDTAKEFNIPRFHIDEIVPGRVAGRGGFCVVREIDEIRLKDPDDGDDDDRFNTTGSVHSSTSNTGRRRFGGGGTGSKKRFGRGILGGSTRMFEIEPTDSSNHNNSREYLARRVWSQQKCKYVIKQVNPDLFKTNKPNFLKGTIDLALESKYLASLGHPHIATLRGICHKSPSQVVGYFVILDHLPELLTHRLNTWMHTYRATCGITGFITRGKKRSNALGMERLLVAYDIASALHYLHNKRIIYRDLKPDNIGFDADGVLKLFDFGLAKELIEEERTENGLYKMTGMTGAMRYMAPEVALNQPYDLKADVYSWGMLFWYVMALEPPLGFFTPNMFIDRVFIEGIRPAINEKWGTDVGHVMNEAWHANSMQRPDFTEVMTSLRAAIRALDPAIGLVTGDNMNDTKTAVSYGSAQTI